MDQSTSSDRLSLDGELSFVNNRHELKSENTTDVNIYVKIDGQDEREILRFTLGSEMESAKIISLDKMN